MDGRRDDRSAADLSSVRGGGRAGRRPSGAARTSQHPYLPPPTPSAARVCSPFSPRGRPPTELDHAASLERAAYTALRLLQELRASSAEVSAVTATRPGGGGGPADGAEGVPDGGAVLPSLDDDERGIDGVAMEKSRFLMKLAPRIRQLESDTAKCLVGRLESLLAKVREAAEEARDRAAGDDEGAAADGRRPSSSPPPSDLLLTVGACLRGLALLSRGSDAESAFARVAIMPILRARLSMGRLDEGGARGECAGLFSLLDDVAAAARGTYGPLLRDSEGMFAPAGGPGNGAVKVEVDLVTCGVWVPVATALMADPKIKMAVFSPGHANVLQANYSALDTFLSELAGNLLREEPPSSPGASGASEDASQEEEKRDLGDFSHLHYRPDIDAAAIARAQVRLYAHPATVDYYKRWNLPIYYQLRFAEFCKRLDGALDGVRRRGWQAAVFAGGESQETKIGETPGFELPLFLELYDVLLTMWSPDVFLRPLTHRFLRGVTQLVGRVLAFVREGLEGQIEFGGSCGDQSVEGAEESSIAATSSDTVTGIPPYHWNERVEDIAVVSWELTILDTCMTHDYLDVVAATVCPACPPDKESQQSTCNSPKESDETRLLASEFLTEASGGIASLVSRSWNELIVDNLTSRCCAPLSAVKGVAATYRMTNRPPPTQASPFVSTILRALEEFDTAFASRTPPQIGDGWKCRVVSATADKYSLAVEELIATVKRTEEALKSRKTRRMMAGGMSDGEKVKLQLYLDYMEFKSHVEKLGVDGRGVAGLVKLSELTKEAESLFQRTQQKK